MATGNILDEILAERSSRIRRCGLGRWLNGLGEADRDKVEQALTATDDDGKFVVLHTEVADYLTARMGFATNEYMVGHHRRDKCACKQAA